MPRSASGPLALCLASVGLAFSTTATAQIACDATVTPTAGTDGYTRRTDGVPRCEGVYRRRVGGDDIYFMAWAWKPIRYDLDSIQAMSVAWSAPDTGPVRLLIDALPSQNLAYRMDARPAPGDNHFTWPANIARSHVVDTRRLRAEVTRDPDGRPPYLPIVANDETCSEPDPELVLFAGTSIGEIKVSTFAGADIGGEPISVDTLQGSRQRGRFTVDVPADLGQGVYRIMLQANSRSSGRPIDAASFTIYHPGTWDAPCQQR